MRAQISLSGISAVRRSISIIALLLVAHLVAAPDASGQQSATGDEKRAAQVRAKAEAFGVGTEVTVSMRNGSKQGGRIQQITEQNLVLDKRGQTESIPFVDVRKIDRQKSIWASKALWGAIIAGAVVVILAISKPLKD